MSDYFASMFHQAPVLVAPGQESWLGSCISALQAKLDAVGPEQMKEWAATGDDNWWGEEGSILSMLRPYKVENGVLRIPVRGMLLHNFPFATFGLATGYDYIVKAVRRGMEDPDVSSIAMEINSGGGHVAGAFDATDRIYNMRGGKPMVALVNEHAFSAAFSIATATDRIVLPRTGSVGSVGVVTAHVSRQAALDQAGVEVTFVYAGKHKTDGNPFEALSADAKERMQARIDGIYNIFVSTVARNLGVEPETVRATEALTYDADEAVRIGFAHSVGPIDEALSALGGPQATAGEITMSQPVQEPTEAATTADQASLDAARAEGRKEGAQQERERIEGILTGEHATTRLALATHLAMKTDMSAAAASEILAVSPEEAVAASTPAPGASAFEAAMANGNPNISPEADAGGNDEPEGEELVSAILGDYHAVAGKPAKTN